MTYTPFTTSIYIYITQYQFTFSTDKVTDAEGIDQAKKFAQDAEDDVGPLSILLNLDTS